MTHDLRILGAALRKSACTLSIRLVWPFVELAPQAQRAELIARLRTQLGLNQIEFENIDTRVSLQLAIDLLERLVAETGVRNIGLIAGQRATSEHLGIVEFLARSEVTLGDALQSNVRHARLLADGAHQSMETKDGAAFLRLRFDSNLSVHAAVYEYMLAVLLGSARRITSMPEFTPREVHFVHAQPHNADLHSQVFKCVVRFSMPVTQFVLSAPLMQLPLRRSDPTLRRLLQQQASAMIEALPRNEDLVTTVRDILIAEPDLGDTSASRVARRIGVSVRTVSRRLALDGTSFRTLLDETRKQVALRDLTETHLSITTIAQQLGFSSNQSFYRAFRRWTGETAVTFRNRMREQSVVH